MAPRSSQPPATEAQCDLLLDKIEKEEGLSTSEKCLLLRTGQLAYKALLYPGNLSPAERNRIRLLPPPEEVEENIKLITQGTMSTQDEFYDMAISDAEHMTDEQLRVGLHFFRIKESVYQGMLFQPFMSKLGRAGNLAHDAVTTPKELEAYGRMGMEWNFNQKRRDKWFAEEGEEQGECQTREAREAYHAKQGAEKKAAAEQARQWDAQDEELFRLAEEWMRRKADELECWEENELE